MAFPPTFTDVWDITQPPDTQLANLLGQDIRNLKNDVMQRMSILCGQLANRPTPETVNATWGALGSGGIGQSYGIIFLANDTGQFFQWNGTAWVDISYVFIGATRFFGGVSLGTVSNTTVTLPVATFQYNPNNISQVGQAIRLTASGVISSPAAGAPVVYTAIDGSISSNQGILLALSSSSNIYWEYTATFNFTAVGTSGVAAGMSKFLSSANAFANSLPQATASPSITFNTQTLHTIGLYIQWDAATSTRSITGNSLLAERIS